MTKIKIIKREDAGVDSTPAPPKPTKEKPKKQRSMESTVKDWITERRENDDAETRTRNSQLDEWNTDLTPATTEPV